MKDFKYQKNYLQYSYNSTETFDVKISCKKNAKFIQTHALSQPPFVQFRPYVISLLGLLLSLTLMSKTKKDPGDEFGPYAFVQDLRWRNGRGSCFECELFRNSVP